MSDHTSPRQPLFSDAELAELAVDIARGSKLLPSDAPRLMATLRAASERAARAEELLRRLVAWNPTQATASDIDDLYRLHDEARAFLEKPK